MSKRQEIFFRQIVVACDVVTLVVSYAAAYWARDHFLRPLVWGAVPLCRVGVGSLGHCAHVALFAAQP